MRLRDQPPRVGNRVVVGARSNRLRWACEGRRGKSALIRDRDSCRGTIGSSSEGRSLGKVECRWIRRNFAVTKIIVVSFGSYKIRDERDSRNWRCRRR